LDKLREDSYTCMNKLTDDNLDKLTEEKGWNIFIYVSKFVNDTKWRKISKTVYAKYRERKRQTHTHLEDFKYIYFLYYKMSHKVYSTFLKFVL
jgi:hypothetical protein